MFRMAAGGRRRAPASTGRRWSGGWGWTCRCTVQYAPLDGSHPACAATWASLRCCARNRSVELIGGRLSTTIELGLVAVIVGVLIGVPIGIYSAVRQDTVGDYVGRSFAIFGLATPNFWLATIILVFPAIWWAWSPPLRLVRLSADFGAATLSMFIVPGLILGTYLAASTMRMTRTMMLEVLRQDYIRTAWAKGLRERLVILRHVIKNALIPVVTLVGLQIPIIVGGSVIMEQMFAIPGLGRLMIGALLDRDYPLISGINLFFAAAVMVINLLVDVLYAYLDPRVHYG